MKIHRRGENQEYRSHWRHLNKFAGLAAILYVVVCDITGSSAVGKTLFGSFSKPSSIPYYNFAIQRFVRDRVLNKLHSIEEIKRIQDNKQIVIYLNVGGGMGNYSIQFDSCSNYQDSDGLYNKSYVIFLLQTALNGYNSNINLTAFTHTVIVDCSYDGRTVQDTSTFKVYMVDNELLQIYSFTFQTMLVSRIRSRTKSSCAPMTISCTNFNSFQASPILSSSDALSMGLSSNETSTYKALIAYEFPFLLSGFHEINIAETTPTMEWHARDLVTNESIILYSVSEFYRRSPTEQADFFQFVWDLPGDPVKDITVAKFVSLAYTKDPWAWIQSLVIAGLSYRILTTLLIAILASINIYITESRLYFPDIFPAVQHEIVLRSVILIFALACDNFWGIELWAIVQGYLRDNNNAFAVVSENIRSDMLTFYFTWCYTVCILLKTNANQGVVVLIFALCYYYSGYLAQNYGMYNTEGLALRNELWLADLLQSNTPIHLWSYYELSPLPMWYVISEMTWLLIASIIAAAFIALPKMSMLLIYYTQRL